MSDVELTVSAGGREPGAFRLAGTLAIAAFLSGIVLSGVYEFTKPVIAANKARELREAVFKVVPGATRLRRFALRDGELVPVAEDEAVTAPVIHAAYDDAGAFRGWAISGDGPGFQDTIRLLYGYDPARGVITGMQILESRETPGLGSKIYKDPDFVANFDGLAVEPVIVTVKGGRNADNEVDAITGATISSKAVVSIINKANDEWLRRLPPAGTEPPIGDGADK